MQRPIPIIFALFTLFLVGCVSKVSSIKLDVDSDLGKQSGYLLIGIESNIGLENIFIEGEKSFRLSREDLQKGTNYFLIEMPQGNYNFEKIKTSRWLRYELEDEYWEFKVQQGVVSYIGHLKVEGRGFWSRQLNLELENRSSEALAFMENDFPTILQNRKIRYGGPGEDKFFEKMEAIFNKEAAL